MAFSPAKASHWVWLNFSLQATNRLQASHYFYIPINPSQPFAYLPVRNISELSDHLFLRNIRRNPLEIFKKLLQNNQVCSVLSKSDRFFLNVNNLSVELMSVHSSSQGKLRTYSLLLFDELFYKSFFCVYSLLISCLNPQGNGSVKMPLIDTCDAE